VVGQGQKPNPPKPQNQNAPRHEQSAKGQHPLSDQKGEGQQQPHQQGSKA
jgi:hypothetical protein